MSKLWDSFIHPLSKVARRKRAEKILAMYPPFNDVKVLDLGGSRHYWEKLVGILEPKDLTLLNIADSGQEVSSSHLLQNMKIEIYDGRAIPYPDNHFDVVICNSVIEHVPPPLRAGLMKEIARVGQSYFIQTPANVFPIEPHFVMPFVHWLPRALGKRLVHYSVYAALTRNSRRHIDAYFDEIQLLSKRELLGYIPSARIVPERFLGLPKSYTLVHIGEAKQ